jgi:hypothetical protein
MKELITASTKSKIAKYAQPEWNFWMKLYMFLILLNFKYSKKLVQKKRQLHFTRVAVYM